MKPQFQSSFNIRHASVLLLTSLALDLAALPARAADGDVDPGFNPNANDTVYGVAVQADGHVVLGGMFRSVGGADRDGIARVDGAGTLDSGFTPSTDNLVRCVAVQADGKILFAGEFRAIGSTTRNLIARVTAAGLLDSGFDPNVGGSYPSVHCVMVQPDGMILLGGYFATVGGAGRYGIARVNGAGALDTSFNLNLNGIVSSVAVQADGKILLGGSFTSVGGTARTNLARVNASGLLDTSFNPNLSGTIESLTVQADGKILLGGSFSTVGGTAHANLARLNANGTADTNFNQSVSGTVKSLALQADGAILLGGNFTAVGGTARANLARLDASGALDVGFNPNAPGGSFGVLSVAVQADGKILLGGDFTSVGATARNHIARLLNGPATQTLSIPDTTQVQWQRGGTAPEVEQVTFEVSTNNGSTWTAVGTGVRSSGGWARTGLSLPPSGWIRARGRANSSSLNEQVGNYDFVPPVLTCPIDVVMALGFGQCEVSASYSVTAIDNMDPSPTVTCVPPSGASLPVGRKNVLCTARDAVGNTSTGSFPVSVYPFPAVPAGMTWKPRASAQSWSCVASSAGGTKLVAGGAGGPLYTSTDSGVTWTACGLTGNWSAVASSTNGMKLIAADHGGLLHTSSDAGATWTNRAFSADWEGVASSADGTKLVALAYNDYLYTSTDSGLTWTARSPHIGWLFAASSDDGTKLVATTDGGPIYTSTDSGTNWTARESGRWWTCPASSADGSRLVAAASGGQIYTSTDFGQHWSPHATIQDWRGVASSADGSRLVAAANGDQLYISTDSGVTWAPRETARAWQAVASSASGAKLVAVVNGGQIYTSSENLLRPSILGATDLVFEAGNAAGAVATFSVTATNTCQPVVSLACTPSSGSTFPLGTSTVTCVATDALGISNTATFTVLVRDTTPPACPPEVLLTAPPDQCAAALAVTVTDACDPAPQVTCVPPVGTPLPVGRTTVLCSAADARGNSNTCAFAVSVYPSRQGSAGETWTPRLTDTNRYWRSVASSDDGSKLVAAPQWGPLYTSTDSGVTWIPRGDSRQWVSVASMADGSKLVAGDGFGQLYTSTDSGVSWTPRETSRLWLALASSADGTRLVAADYSGTDGNGGQLYTSTDSGVTWTPRATNRLWCSVASSANGAKLIAVVANEGHLYTSTDSGTNWIEREGPAYWTCVASSADGTKLVAVAGWDHIYTSTDSGTNWVPRETERIWSCVASSADGSKLIAAVQGGQIYASTDSGVTWTPRAGDQRWWTLASSADGAKLVAGVYDGLIYTSQSLPVQLAPPPGLLGATNLVVEASSAAGAVIAFSVTATNLCQLNVPVICTPTNGSTFPLGATPVTCVAADVFGVTNTASFTVRVVDTTAPICPWQVVLTAPAGQCAAPLVVTVSDACDSHPSVVCVPPVGTLLPVGRTNVLCFAQDSHGNSNTCLIPVLVYPALRMSPCFLGATNQWGNADPSGSLASSFSVTATNLCQSSVPVTCTPSPGAIFPVGATVVTCVALDELGQSNTITFTVTVRDVTPPSLACPTNLVLTAPPGQCEAALPVITATDNVDPSPVVTCAPPAGTLLPVGRTNVLCLALDASGNHRACSFSVSVYPSRFGPAGETWTPRRNDRGWECVASSADGRNLVAVAHDGQLYTSTDSGETWTAHASELLWSFVVSSEDGTRLAALSRDGSILTSADAGTNWTQTSAPLEDWAGLASSADGTKLIAVAKPGPIYTSPDSGTTWIAHASYQPWQCVASSADGTKLVAAVELGHIYTSADGGTTWAPRPLIGNWTSVASSADGTKLVAVDGLGDGPDGGQVYTSTDTGQTWTPRETNRYWSSVASSADGTKLVAVAKDGPICTSTDSGVSWTPRTGDWDWTSVASSADGSRLVAVALHFSMDHPSPVWEVPLRAVSKVSSKGVNVSGDICTSVGSAVPLTEPPTILGATNREIAATGPGGAEATFSVTATNPCQPYVSVTCTPPSGSTFPLGANAVICIATDDFGATNTADFTLQVTATPVAGDLTASLAGTNAATGLPEARLHASINPNGLPTTTWFQYGLTTNYGGSTLPADSPEGYVGNGVVASLDGLLAGATYHWQVVASNSLGVTYGLDQILAVPGRSGATPGDANGDGLVDQNELDAVLAHYWPTSPWLCLTNPAGLGGTNIVFTLTGATAGAFRVEYSTNLVDWLYLGSATPRYEFADPAALATPQRFYRLRWPQ